MRETVRTLLSQRDQELGAELERIRTLEVSQMVLAVLHPKGGVGRSTTVWQLGAELALRASVYRLRTWTRAGTYRAYLNATQSAWPVSSSSTAPPRLTAVISI